MSRSDTYKYVDAFVSTVPADFKVKLQSQTYYVGPKGDEIADYAYNYTTKTDASGVYTSSKEKNSSIFFYGAAFERAAAVSTETEMSRSDTYKYADNVFISSVPADY